MIGCEKDPSFARGRNLITYAVDLMGSKSPDDYLSGLRIMDAFAKLVEKLARGPEENSIPSADGFKTYIEENILTKYLIVSASSADILQKLLQTLGARSIYDRETRECAARIVANIALDIHLEEFPGGIRYISSLIDTFEEHPLLQVQPCQLNWLMETFEEDWYLATGLMALSDCDKQDDTDEDQRQDSDADLLNAYMELVVQGLRILRKLATNNKNLRIMLDTPGLLYKIMAPVTSDLLHHIDHGTWYNIVEGSLRVITHLAAATGQTGKKLRSEIASSKEAINNMEKILECEKCDEKLQGLVILILSDLYQDTSSVLGTASRKKFIEMLVHIMVDDNKDKENRRIRAGWMLVALSSEIETNAMIIMKATDNVVDNFTAMVVVNDRCGPAAAKVLENLCFHYTDNDKSFIVLKKAMIDAVPKVLGEIVCLASEETHKGTEVGKVRSTEQETDVENQCGNSQDNGQGNLSSSSNQRNFKMSDQSVIYMLSLCVTICDTFISADEDLAHLFDAITPGDSAYSFPRELKKIVTKNMHPRSDCLTIVKLACKMFISMMKHRGSYVKEDLESLMDVLSSASKEMFLLDGSLVFNIREQGATTWNPFRSLASLVKEAQELVDI